MNKYHIITIYPNGMVESLEQVQRKSPDLAQLQAAVGGYIQELPHFTTYTLSDGTKLRGQAYADEDGLMKGLPINLHAIKAWKDACPEGELSRMKLVGKVIFVAPLVTLTFTQTSPGEQVALLPDGRHKVVIWETITYGLWRVMTLHTYVVRERFGLARSHPDYEDLKQGFLEKAERNYPKPLRHKTRS